MDQDGARLAVAREFLAALARAEALDVASFKKEVGGRILSLQGDLEQATEESAVRDILAEIESLKVQDVVEANRARKAGEEAAAAWEAMPSIVPVYNSLEEVAREVLLDGETAAWDLLRAMIDPGIVEIAPDDTPYANHRGQAMGTIAGHRWGVGIFGIVAEAKAQINSSTFQKDRYRTFGSLVERFIEELPKSRAAQAIYIKACRAGLAIFQSSSAPEATPPPERSLPARRAAVKA